MLTSKQKKFLNSIFNPKEIIWEKASLFAYGVDSSSLHGEPEVVVLPSKVDQIQKLLFFAQNEGIHIVPRGRGTGRAGACVPKKGIVVSLLKLNHIIEIRKNDFVVIVEPGVITYNLQQELKKYNLFYPPDPASVKFSTIGGNVATNAGGMQALKYGVTGDYVLGLEVVLADGTLLNLKNFCHKNVCGLNLAKLFVGSEGTLGIISKIYLKVLPLPNYSVSILFGFKSLDKAISNILNLFKEGFLPCALEIIDKNCLNAISKVDSLPWEKDLNIQTVLIVKFDGTENSVKEDINRVLSLFSADVSIVGKTEEEQEKIWELRRKISPAAYRLKPAKLSEDFTVPRGKIGEFLRAGERLSNQYDLPVLTFGHVGDGNIHTNIMYDPEKIEDRKKADKIHRLLLEKTLELEGTITGEHGIGLLKKKYIGLQLDSNTLQIMNAIKCTLDPNNILNPGKAF
ncbi:glycolate oxidase [Desulfonauticus submarinus]|uniref:Glycolate oxidase n=1 Tax=Desulfonauticus submarinus TaxID=206665 RepID=A0A1H0DX19_9BACT|nr:FAD-linked oxidase C-terminal domain-containing protein [Desulfonauticus submarinus]SDN74797.1 glycolate oxidase [Desulfonauticus submarinus]